MEKYTRIFCTCLLVLLLITSIATAQSPPDNRPIVIVREDDCRGTWRKTFSELGDMNALEYGKLKHIPVTWAVITNNTNGSRGVGNDPLTWAELIDYVQTAGGELGSHSVTHSLLSSAAAYISEITTSKAIIEQHVPHCKIFFQPGTWKLSDGSDPLGVYLDKMSELNNSVGQAIQSNYLQSQAFLGGGWSIGKPSYRYGLYPTYGIDYGCFTGIDAMLVSLDVVANTPGAVITIYCHGVQNVGGTTDTEARVDMLKAFMDKLASLRDTGKIRLMNMSDAYDCSFSDNLNCIPDPGFETSQPGSTSSAGNWRLWKNSYISSNGGRNGTKGGVLPNNLAAIGSCPWVLSPGRYELSWYQRWDITNDSKPLTVWINNYEPDPMQTPIAAVNFASYGNSSLGVWERKYAYLLIHDKLPFAGAWITTLGSSVYTIDDLCLVKAPLDPGISTTNLNVTPRPGQAVFSWLTPTDAGVTKVRICYGKQTHPITPTQGTLLADVVASPGAPQQITTPIDWTSQSTVYFSAFAMKPDGSFTSPDIAMLSVNKSVIPPTLSTAVNLMGNVVNADWVENSPEQQPHQYSYGLGSNPHSANIVGWQTTENTSVCMQVPESAIDVYFLVKEQNAFGFWSDVSAQSLMLLNRMKYAISQIDGITVSITGIISAKYSDCFYIEQANGVRGLKVIGTTSSQEGATVLVSGQMTTVAGERAIICN